MTRRVLLGAIALMMIVGLVPSASHASCYPVPDQYCPPGTIKPGQRIPTIPRLSPFPAGFPGDPHQTINPLIATVNQQIDTVNAAINQTNNAIAGLPGLQNPLFSVWPEMQMAIVPGTTTPVDQFTPANVTVRHGGKLFIHNASMNLHTFTDGNCVNADGSLNGNTCKFRFGIYPGQVGPTAGMLPIETSKFSRPAPGKPNIYTFRCEIYPDMTGSFVAA